ncbi:MAG: hypothetical protein RLZZ242_289 [Bacteroidota bacterium]
MVAIRKIEPQLLLPVRHAVLRPGYPIEACVFDGDYAPHSVHFGAYQEEQLIGCASLVVNYTPKLEVESTAIMQLRGMAVLDPFRNSGVGALLLRAAEDHARTKNIHTIWFNARIKAVSFYERNGYLKQGDPYEIEGVGTHFFMFKTLTQHA